MVSGVFTLLHYAVTDKVKAVNLCLIMASMYHIQCSDTAGIVASRYSYVLVSVVEGLNDIIGTIAENSYMNEDIPVLNDYYRILVFLTLYTLLYHVNISLLHNNDIIV